MFLFCYPLGNSSPYKNPNKFVDQGYNDINYVSPTNSRNQSITPTGTRIIPVHIDGQISPFNVKLSDAISVSPTILQK